MNEANISKIKLASKRLLDYLNEKNKDFINIYEACAVIGTTNYVFAKIVLEYLQATGHLERAGRGTYKFYGYKEKKEE